MTQPRPSTGADSDPADSGPVEPDPSEHPDTATEPSGRGGLLRVLEDRGLCAVLVMVVLWCAVMYLHVWRRHDRYGTFDNDLGFHDQFVWLLARGKTFSTVLGLPPFGHNATFGYFLLVPFSWLGMGPQGLNLINTVAVGLGAVPLYLLARDRLGDPWRAVPFGLVWLLHPVVQGNVWETFHPDALAMAPLLAAYLCASRRRWWWFGLWAALALIWKADVSLALAALGVLVAIRWNRRVGWATVGIAVLWFTLTVGVMIPRNSGGGTVFGPLYGDLGDTPLDVAKTAVTDPAKVVRRVGEHEPVRYGRDLLAPYGMVPLLSPAPLLIGVPQAVINVLSDLAFTREWRDNHHYQALPMVAMAIALVEAVGWLDRRSTGWLGRASARRRGRSGGPERPKTGTIDSQNGRGVRVAGVVTAFVVATSFAATVAWGPLPPFTTQFAHYWSADGDPARAAKDRVIELVGPTAPVSAHYLLVPHLTHREVVYSFPNPWRQVFYGVAGTELPDPRGVKVLAMDTNLLDDSTRQLWDCIIGSGAFGVLWESQGIVYAERIEGRDDDLACR
jgi:uncharacterized membrane protein